MRIVNGAADERLQGWILGGGMWAVHSHQRGNYDHLAAYQVPGWSLAWRMSGAWKKVRRTGTGTRGMLHQG